MGKEYRDKTGEVGSPTTSPEMRELFKRPGRQDKDGKPIYFTEQSHKKECDVTNIVKKYDKTGLINHISKFEASFGDTTGADFKTAQDLVTNAMSLFNSLPSEIRNEFDNSPQNLLQFMENPENRDKAIELGLINKDWTLDTDGLGEHVHEGGNVKENDLPPPEPPPEPTA